MADYTILWGFTLGICVLFLFATIYGFFREWASYGPGQRHLVPAVISIICYMMSAAFNFTDTLFTSIAFEVVAIYFWALAEVGIHSFFIVHIYETFHNDRHADELNSKLRLQKREKIVLAVLIGIFVICQIYMGINTALLHDHDTKKINHLTANRSDLAMGIISLVCDVAVCIYLFCMFRSRLRRLNVNPADVNNQNNDLVATLTKYYLLLGVGTVVTFIGYTANVVADALHVHDRSSNFWVDGSSAADKVAYVTWAADIIINIFLIYLNIEPGKWIYKGLCVRTGLDECASKSTLDENDTLLHNGGAFVPL